jgi:hypothetical protein
MRSRGKEAHCSDSNCKFHLQDFTTWFWKSGFQAVLAFCRLGNTKPPPIFAEFILMFNYSVAASGKLLSNFMCSSSHKRFRNVISLYGRDVSNVPFKHNWQPLMHVPLRISLESYSAFGARPFPSVGSGQLCGIRVSIDHHVYLSGYSLWDWHFQHSLISWSQLPCATSFAKIAQWSQGYHMTLTIQLAPSISSTRWLFGRFRMDQLHGVFQC